MDTVFINGLRVYTTIGVYEKERHIKQLLLLDIELGCDTRAPGKSDDVKDALDYDAISRRCVAFAEASQYYLVEALAEQLAGILLDEFSIERIKLTINKPGAVEKADTVGITIERERP